MTDHGAKTRVQLGLLALSVAMRAKCRSCSKRDVISLLSCTLAHAVDDDAFRAAVLRFHRAWLINPYVAGSDLVDFLLGWAEPSVVQSARDATDHGCKAEGRRTEFWWQMGQFE